MPNQPQLQLEDFQMLVAILTGDEDLAREATIAHRERIGQPVRHGEVGEPLPAPADVYRVEMPDGRGPFISRGQRKVIYEELTKPVEGWPGYLLLDPRFQREQAGITEKAFNDAHGAARYGCACLASVNTWFPPPSRSYLASLGAKIVHYQLPAGSYLLDLDAAGEVIFSVAQAKKVDELPVDIPITESLPVHPTDHRWLEEYKAHQRMKEKGNSNKA
jgi:hypothetical protein